MNPLRDRFGIGWRPELAAALWARLEDVDVIEVLADDWLGADRGRLRALQALARAVPVTLHGVGLGLASSEPADERRLGALARLVEAVRPEAWSEHLAFVRGGGLEIGHLAAPPRSARTAAATAQNLERAARVVGSPPLVENVATLIDPPLSDLDEVAWTNVVLAASGCGMVLDLHNLHANACNFGFDAHAAVRALPGGAIRQVHLAGGSLAGSGGSTRVLDDHCHAVPDAVFLLLATVGAHAPGPLTVVLERDGRYPSLDELLGELRRARSVLAAARTTREASACP